MVVVQLLPTNGFKWVVADIKDVLNTSDDSDYGYMLEVDLRYPLHDAHNEYPLAPEKMNVTMLSPYQREMLPAQYKAAHPKWSDSDIDAKIDTYQSSPKARA